MISNKISSAVALLRLDKPIGIFLLLWPTLMALWIAGEGKPDLTIVCVFIIGTVITRSAGCVINDLMDQKFDKQVARTCSRPLVSGLSENITPFEAKILFVILLILGFGLVTYLNRYTIGLSMVAVLLFTIYPLMKRYTYWPQAVLGLAFSWGIPMAYAALYSSFNKATWMLFLANFCWIMAYDTQYAMADREDDLKAGVKSTAILFGRYDCLMIGVFQVGVLGFMMYLGYLLSLGTLYYLSVLLVLSLFLYHQFLIRYKNAQACLKAFKHNHYVGMSLFMGLVLDYQICY